MRNNFVLFASAAALCFLAGCASLGQMDYQAYLDTGKAFYTAYCVATPKSDYCTADAKKKAADAYKTASDAIAAYNAGKINQAELQKAIAAALKLFADFQG